MSIETRGSTERTPAECNGIGIVTCVYVNPELDRYGLIDYLIYDKQGDDKSKLDHVRDMLSVLVYSRHVAFSRVLMDSWYASKSLLLYIESPEKTYYCPLKSNRLVDDSQGSKPYQRIDTLQWTVETEFSQLFLARVLVKYNTLFLLLRKSYKGKVFSDEINNNWMYHVSLYVFYLGGEVRG